MSFKLLSMMVILMWKKKGSKAPVCKCTRRHYHIIKFEPGLFSYESVFEVNPNANSFKEYINHKGYRQKAFSMPGKGYYERASWVDEVDSITSMQMLVAVKNNNFTENRRFSAKEMRIMRDLKLLGDM